MDALRSATEDAEDVDVTIRLAGMAGQATIIDDDEVERELHVLMKDADSLAVKELAALGDSQQLGERLGGVITSAGGSRKLCEAERVAPVKEAVHI